MSEAFQLHKMLEEIVEDEKISTSKRKKISQADIGRMVVERRAGKKDSAGMADAPAKSPDTQPATFRKDISETEIKPAGRTIHPLPDARPVPSSGACGLCSDNAGNIPQIFSRIGFLPSMTLSGQSSALGPLPLRFVLKNRTIPLQWGDRVIQLAMENPGDSETIYDVEILTGMRVEAIRVDPGILDEAIRQFTATGSSAEFESGISSTPDSGDILAILLEILVILDGSDLLINQGVAPWVKTPTHLERLENPVLSTMDCVHCAKSLMTEKQWERFLEAGAAVVSWQDPQHGRFRARVFREQNVPALAIRRIPNALPPLDELGLSPWFEDIAKHSRGLMVIAGPPGQGKTTTLHALVHEINSTKSCRMLLLENPIEYVHQSITCHISQREIGKDTDSIQEGIKHAIRRGSDVIVVGELVSQTDLIEALKAAQSGHLVLATLESHSTRTALEWMAHEVTQGMSSHGLSLLEDALLGISSQRLVAGAGMSGVIPVCERLTWSPRIRDLVRSTPIEKLRDHIRDGDDDFVSLEAEMQRLAAEGRIPSDPVLEFTQKGH
jgi:twitching motility protein PilT